MADADVASRSVGDGSRGGGGGCCRLRRRRRRRRGAVFTTRLLWRRSSALARDEMLGNELDLERVLL